LICRKTRFTDLGRENCPLFSRDFLVQTVIATLFERHDLWLVALAALVCFLSAFAGMSLLHHARRTEGAMRGAWIGVAAVSVGFGIWATHFVAMLAFDAGMPTGYDIPLTLVSLAIAVAIVGGGMWYVTLARRTADALLGGAVVGLGISAMHYVGMAALMLGGEIVWAPELVASSLVLGMGLGALAIFAGTRRATVKARLQGTGLLTLAIVSMHFTGMGAANLANCFPIVAGNDVTPVWMSLVVAVVSILILLFALGGIFLDMRERARAVREGERMRGLADAAVEGLLVCKDDAIVTANASFLQMVGLNEEQVAGRNLAEFLGAGGLATLLDRPNQSMELQLNARGGAKLPVEVVQRPVDFGGRPHLAIAVRDLTARKSAEQHIRYLAHHDPLTGLPNRASFGRALEDEIARARRDGKMFAVLCLDLDRFKEVNDLFGHPAGDALLQRVSSALLTAVGNLGSAARLGGDEFAVLLNDVGSAAKAGRMAEAIIDTFRRNNETLTTGAPISASIGIAVFPNDAEDAEQMMSHADTALYRAKQDGRGIYRFYKSEMGAEVRDRRMLEHDLRHAISRNELTLVYQPQIDIQSGDVTGFEALVRWTHPERGSVSPGIFIPVAEETGLILQIGDWVLRTACIEAASWTAPLSIAVNVSAVQVHAPNFSHSVHEVLVQTGLSPSRLEIEITETALIRDMPRAVATLRQIKALGVSIAMDDFGTGYSSLANLRAFPFSKIKVDQSFIKLVDSNEQSAAIVRAVLGLGSGLDVPVLAEGVERPEELEFLRNEICQGAQGYLLSRPAAIGTFSDVTDGTAKSLPPDVAIELRLAG
jgi:diguanylate cyclase (GGDEF)-like protein/PAS domain S-box-containing protein